MANPLVQLMEVLSPGGGGTQLTEAGFIDPAWYDPDIDLTSEQGGAAYYRRITQSPADLQPLVHERMQELAAHLYDRNPIAKRAMNVIRDHVVGKGFAVGSKDEDVEEVIRKFWSHPDNEMDKRVWDLVLELGIFGEQVVAAFVHRSSGQTVYSHIDPRTIRQVVAAPGRPDSPYAICLQGDMAVGEARWLKVIRAGDDGTMRGAEPGEVYRPTKDSDPIPFWRPAELDSNTDLVGCFFWSLNKTRGARRGRSDLLPVMDFVDLFDRMVFDEAERMSLLRSFIWEVEVRGASAQELRDRAAKEPPPKPGTVIYRNENEKWAAMTPDLKSADAATAADLVLSLIATGVGVSKAQPLSSRILTPKGWVRMGDMRVGDLVITPKGCPAPVVGVYPQGVKDIYELTFSDGSKARSTDDHLWFTQDQRDRRMGSQGSVKQLKDIRPTLRAGAAWNHRVPLVSPMPGKYGIYDYEVHPYVLGCLLGDGHIRTRGGGHVEVTLASEDVELIDRVNDLLPEGHFSYSQGCSYFYYGPPKRGAFKTALREMGLVGVHSWDKFIPQEYMDGDPEARWELLRGLLDTDGSPRKSNAVYCTVSPRLQDDVRQLVRSLGGTCKVYKQQSWYTVGGVRKLGRVAYQLLITLPNGTEYFSLERKQELVQPHRTGPLSTIRSVELVTQEEAQCIAVDDPEHLYVTDDYVVTRNTWLNGAMDVNRATAGSMDEPTRKTLESRQRYVAQIVEQMATFAVQSVQEAGGLAKGPVNMTVHTPEMYSKDLGRGAGALFQGTQALGMAKAAGWMDGETPLEVIAGLLVEVGVNIDASDLKERIEKERKAAEAQNQQAGAAGEIPSYLGVGTQFGSDALGKAVSGGQQGAGAVAPKDAASIASQIASSLVQLGQSQVVDVEVAQEIFAHLMRPLGVNIDLEAMRQRLEEEEAKATAQGEVDQELPPQEEVDQELPPQE